MYAKSFQITDPLPTLEELEVIYKKSGKCATEIKRGKSGIIATVMNNSRPDYLIITKNGYHGVGISVNQEQGQNFFAIGQCIPSRIIAWLRGQAGWLLLPLFPIIWGKQKEFYEEIDAFIQNNFHVESMLDANDMNIMNMLKKK